MKISEKGIELIKGFESLSLKACKALPTEKYYTIGYGHYGKDVKENDTITKEKANALFLTDLEKFEKKVNKYADIYNFSQNEYDALVSFCYNVGNIDKLTANGRRTKTKIADAMLKYVNSGGKKIAGLVRRRTLEQRLFLETKSEKEYYKKYVGSDTQIDVIFKKIGVQSKYVGNVNARKAVAVKNGYKNYSGKMSENIGLITLAKNGLLVKA